MGKSSDLVRISLRLANGEYFPLFLYGDPKARRLSLVPATRDQDKVDVQFFSHPPDGSPPLPLGGVRFTNLPPDMPDIELQLDAAIDEFGMLSVVLRHQVSDRVETFDVQIPDEATLPVNHRRLSSSWIWQLMGVVFVLAGLALIFWLTFMVTRWGQQASPRSPISSLYAKTHRV